jgi:hypothetical protein
MKTVTERIREVAHSKVRVRITSKRRSRDGYWVTHPSSIDGGVAATHAASIAEAEQLLLAKTRVAPVLVFEIKPAKKRRGAVVTKFQRADVPQSEIELMVKDVVDKWQRGVPEVRAALTDCLSATQVELRLRRMYAEEAREIYLNDTYQVSVKRGGEMTHLSIKRIDRQPVHDWRDLQRIKSEIIGPEYEGVELYPAESRLVDAANQYHIWVVMNPTYRFPFGFEGGRIVSDIPIGKSVNRKVEA